MLFNDKGLGERNRASAGEGPWSSRATNPGTSPASTVQQEPRNRIGDSIQGGADCRLIAESIPRELVGQLDLEHDPPAKFVPLPVGGALTVAGGDESISLRILPSARRRGPREHLDRQPLGHALASVGLGPADF